MLSSVVIWLLNPESPLLGPGAPPQQPEQNVQPDCAQAQASNHCSPSGNMFLHQGTQVLTGGQALGSPVAGEGPLAIPQIMQVGEIQHQKEERGFPWRSTG